MENKVLIEEINKNLQTISALYVKGYVAKFQLIEDEEGTHLEIAAVHKDKLLEETSNTVSSPERINNLVSILDGYFAQVDIT